MKKGKRRGDTLSPVIQQELRYWQDAIATYVREKREAAGMAQDDIGALSRGMVSTIENGAANLKLGTLLSAVHAVNGDVSEVFQRPRRRVPSDVYRSLLVNVLTLLQSENPAALTELERAARHLAGVYLQSSSGEPPSREAGGAVPGRPDKRVRTPR